MFKIARCVMALSLAVTSITASSQEIQADDTFGHEPSLESAAPAVPGTKRKVNITNAGATGSTPSGTPAPGAAKEDERSARPGVTTAQQLPREEQLNEFQKFVFENAGEVLPIFGSQFFANVPSTFAPISNTPVPSEYRLGPGDELLIRGWGTIDIDLRATIDRNGTISIPTIGAVALSGVRAVDAESIIRNEVAKLYKGVTISVNFGQLRAITVYVVGHARNPGTYTVSSLSTLVTTLFAGGGPNANGSMRRVQVKRAGAVMAELDLYSFIAKGDKSADIKLLDGDTIFIPPAGGFVALTGKVNTPAIYELKTSGDTVESLLAIAGGLPVVADPRRAFLERIDPTSQTPRTVEQFALDGQGLRRVLKDGDVLNVTSITPDFSNAVMLRGNVDQPVRVPFASGMRVRDLIPNREYLISRSSTRRQNEMIVPTDNGQTTDQEANSIAARIGSLIEPINWDYAVIERVNRDDLSVKLIPFNLGQVFADPNGADNIALQPGDRVTIFSQRDVAVPLNKRQVIVRVEGEVNVPGVYQMTAGDTLHSLLAKAGGPTNNAYLFGTGFYREEVRKQQQANLKRAADRLEAQIRSEQSNQLTNAQALASTDVAASTAQFEAQRRLAGERLARFRTLQPTGRIAFTLEPNERSFTRLPQVPLENGDRLVIPAKPAFVHVLGSVSVEASPLWRPNARVMDYLKIAGMASDADVDNVFVLRVDGTVVSGDSDKWFFGKIGGLEVMPGDTIVVPEKLDKTTAWNKFIKGAREWTQILANFGLGAAAIKTLRD